MVSNEVFVGAGAMATLIPEVDMFFNECTVSGAVATLDTSVDDEIKLVPNLYVGCVAKIDTNASAADETAEQYLVIKSNTANTITFNENIDQTVSGPVDVTILSFGAPCVGPMDGSSNATLLSDNWLGLVNTLTPPSVEVEMKQMNLAVSGGRNLDYQFKGAETVSGGSMDISLNNGSWLYYALGKITAMSGGESTTDLVSGSDSDIGTHKGFFIDESAKSIVRGITGNLYPPMSDGDGNPEHRHDDTGIGDNFHQWDGTPITYTFGEADGDILPSFALEVLYSKTGRTSSTTLDSLDPHENMYSRVFTGCQVNTLTLNFEEGQELKTSLDLVTRRAFDSPDGYLPTRGRTGVAALSASAGLANYSATATDNYPFLFSDGAITLFGQTYARVKSGSLTINNNLTPQRFIGNYSREVVSAHLPAQRTYELSFTMLITDTQVWDELRNANESTGNIVLTFEKDSSTNNETESITITLSDYLINNVTVPFPEDKGAIEVEVTATARTLGTTTYTGKWGIVTIGGVASEN